MATKKPKGKDAHPMAFINMAKQYEAGGDALLELRQQKKLGISEPIFLLYFHAIELSLKAYLRTNNVPIIGIREHHDLVRLYEECRQLGLIIGPDDRFDIGNIVEMMTSANEFQSLRYFNEK